MGFNHLPLLRIGFLRLRFLGVGFLTPLKKCNTRNLICLLNNAKAGTPKAVTVYQNDGLTEYQQSRCLYRSVDQYRFVIAPLLKIHGSRKEAKETPCYNQL